jgi:hypothetical protein
MSSSGMSHRSERRLLVTAIVVPSSSILTRATRRNIPEDIILLFNIIFPATSRLFKLSLSFMFSYRTFGYICIFSYSCYMYRQSPLTSFHYASNILRLNNVKILFMQFSSDISQFYFLVKILVYRNVAVSVSYMNWSFHETCVGIQTMNETSNKFREEWNSNFASNYGWYLICDHSTLVL